VDQPTHAWIALRALALIEEVSPRAKLLALLKPQVRNASVGADIPDKKIGVNRGETHVLKMLPMPPGADPAGRFRVSKAECVKRLGRARATARLLDKPGVLPDAWWGRSYRGDVRIPGQHIPNRAMAVATMLKDLLALGDPEVDRALPGTVPFIDRVDPPARARAQQIALLFNVLSHFLADAVMPCHCDGRNLADYRAGLHKQLEDHWAGLVGPAFDDAALKSRPADPDALLAEVRAVDARAGLSFKDVGRSIPDLRPDCDMWLEQINVCRGAFALDCVIAPEAEYPFDDPKARAPFKTVLAKPDLLAEVDRTVLHDAVLNTAIGWTHVWESASRG
jgi:hypothetical protein